MSAWRPALLAAWCASLLVLGQQFGSSLGSLRQALSRVPEVENVSGGTGKERPLGDSTHSRGWKWMLGRDRHVGRRLQSLQLGPGWRGSPLKSEALEGDGEGKVERLLAGEAQVSVPDALPTWARERRHAAVGPVPGKRCCNPLGSRSHVLLPLCPLLRRTIRCLPIAPRFLLPGLWERTWCSS